MNKLIKDWFVTHKIFWNNRTKLGRIIWFPLLLLGLIGETILFIVLIIPLDLLKRLDQSTKK